jgi:hypothetical protein
LLVFFQHEALILRVGGCAASREAVTAFGITRRTLLVSIEQISIIS